jgi:hypothetical protein
MQLLKAYTRPVTLALQVFLGDRPIVARSAVNLARHDVVVGVGIGNLTEDASMKTSLILPFLIYLAWHMHAVLNIMDK